jgi:hypothetical protein
VPIEFQIVEQCFSLKIIENSDFFFFFLILNDSCNGRKYQNGRSSFRRFGSIQLNCVLLVNFKVVYQRYCVSVLCQLLSLYAESLKQDLNGDCSNVVENFICSK